MKKLFYALAAAFAVLAVFFFLPVLFNWMKNTLGTEATFFLGLAGILAIISVVNELTGIFWKKFTDRLKKE